MTPDQSRVWIVKALNAATKYNVRGVEGIADLIVDEIKAAEQALGGAVPIMIAPQQQAAVAGGSISASGLLAQESSSVDISRRIGATAQVVEYSEQETLDLKIKITKQYKETLPLQFTFTPKGFNEEVLMLRHTVASSPGGSMSTISIAYVPNGATSEAQLAKTFIDATKEILLPSEILEQIKESANAVLSPNPRTVESRMPPPMVGMLGDTVSAQEMASGNDLARFQGEMKSARVFRLQE